MLGPHVSKAKKIQFQCNYSNIDFGVLPTSKSSYWLTADAVNNFVRGVSPHSSRATLAHPMLNSMVTE